MNLVDGARLLGLTRSFGGSCDRFPPMVSVSGSSRLHYFSKNLTVVSRFEQSNRRLHRRRTQVHASFGRPNIFMFLYG